MKQIMANFKILFLALLLPCCLACEPLTRNELEYNDTRLMVHIFGKDLAKEMKLKRVHYRTNWDRFPRTIVYAIEMTSGTLSKVVTSGWAKNKLLRDLSEDESDNIHFTFINLGAYDQSKWEECEKFDNKLKGGVIDIYRGRDGWLYWDRSQKPSVAFFYSTDSDLISRL